MSSFLNKLREKSDGLLDKALDKAQEGVLRTGDTLKGAQL